MTDCWVGKKYILANLEKKLKIALSRPIYKLELFWIHFRSLRVVVGHNSPLGQVSISTTGWDCQGALLVLWKAVTKSGTFQPQDRCFLQGSHSFCPQGHQPHSLSLKFEVPDFFIWGFSPGLRMPLVLLKNSFYIWNVFDNKENKLIIKSCTCLLSFSCR